MRSFVCAGVLTFLAGATFAQSGNPPKFDIADVHVSAKATNAFMRMSPARNGRYEIKNATMLDLVRTAYGVNPDRVLGGPNWLELDRFDVIAKMADGSDAEAQRAMLQSLLEDRFKLVARKETKPLPTWVLTAGKQPHLKEADGSGQSGCRIPDGPTTPGEGVIRLFRMEQDGKQTAITLGPGGVVQYACRNMTMGAFAAELRGMLGAQVGPDPVIDETGLKGAWNFDVRWSIGLIGLATQGEQIPVADAIDKQLGLKLEQRPTPKQVVVVESVSRAPTPNVANIAEILPTPPAPNDFEVADVKLAPPPSPTQPPMIQMQMQPGGRFTCRGCPMRMLLQRAFNSNNSEQLAGVPPGLDVVRVDVIAKMSSDAVAGPGIDQEIIAPLVRNLLVTRFKMTYHEEERPVTAYSLVAVKPKLKKADPDSRIFCRRSQAPPGSPPGSQTLTCQNATIAFFAERLQAPGLNWPVLDATGLEGGWDFALTYSTIPAALLNAGRGAPPGADGQPAPLPSASDPSGGYTIFEAIEKQLGLRLKAEKRNEKVIVVDHMETTPTEN
ncbi:MAG TPA: TIGR03435 family protein [Vicinamibacterales bacterium]|nr:TIGR03435 family protein [Vicinamibacterales bacterium]